METWVRVIGRFYIAFLKREGVLNDEGLHDRLI